ncbi:MAG: diaminopimelate epimerase [Candidatus Eiseniibacteriota bacterium]|nr:MAG: diaminopimelate epimerase [Candidatus Eisenbacteria bacterium]
MRRQRAKRPKSSDTVRFYKVTGAGNHFVLLDVRRKEPPMGRPALVRAFCAHGFSVGADGVLFVEKSSVAHIKVLYHNADGREASMCGNGVRCAARFAFEKKLAPAHMRIETRSAVLEARVRKGSVEVDMGRPRGLRQDVAVRTGKGTVVGDVVNTGVPHFVTVPKRGKEPDVASAGAEIRSHPLFRPRGVNVDFVTPCSDGSLAIRTYERGVEAETLACGTGAVAAAVCMATRGRVRSPVRVHTRGGETLTVRFDVKSNPLSCARLEGPAQVVYEGEMPLAVLKRIAGRRARRARS